MADVGFARLKPKAGPAPTESDKAQSSVHHIDSVRYNLAHAVPHLQEAQRHAAKVADAMRSNPKTAPHLAALDAARSGV